MINLLYSGLSHNICVDGMAVKVNGFGVHSETNEWTGIFLEFGGRTLFRSRDREQIFMKHGDSIGWWVLLLLSLEAESWERCILFVLLIMFISVLHILSGSCIFYCTFQLFQCSFFLNALLSICLIYLWIGLGHPLFSASLPLLSRYQPAGGQVHSSAYESQVENRILGILHSDHGRDNFLLERERDGAASLKGMI